MPDRPPDRDEPRRFIITGNRHGRQGRLDSPLVEVVQGPPIQMGERIEVVELRCEDERDGKHWRGSFINAANHIEKWAADRKAGT